MKCIERAEPQPYSQMCQYDSGTITSTKGTTIMSFADNLVFIRQYYGVTQEAIAEQLNVSRQTVSKWEAGTNFPETDKLLLICDLYNTNLDDLMRGSVKLANEKDTQLYDAHMNRYTAGIVALVVGAIVGVSVFLLLDAMGIQDNISSAVFLCFVVVAAMLGIVSGLTHSNFKKMNPYIEPVYSDKVLTAFSRRFVYLISTGIGLILIALVFLVAFRPDEGDFVTVAQSTISFDFFMAAFMFVVAIAVGILVYAGMQKSKYERSEISVIAEDGATVRVREGKGAWSVNKKTPAELRRDHIVGSLCGIIMILATIAFLVIGFGGRGAALSDHGLFSSSGFAYSWISFVVGGLLCGVVAIAGDMIAKPKDDLINEARKEDPWMRVEGSPSSQDEETADANPIERK